MSARVALLVSTDLLTRLDRVDGRVGERAHRTGDEANQHVLVRGQLGELRLIFVRGFLELLVRSEVCT